MNNQKFSFWSLLNSYKIDIPKIQRDYAQGRSDKDDLRRKFLGQIKKALTTPKTTLKLDFIYGATEESNHLVLSWKRTKRLLVISPMRLGRLQGIL